MTLLDALDAERWERANRELLAKLLTELHFEELLAPDMAERGDGTAAMTLRLGPLVLTYEARRRALGHWRVDPASLGDVPDVADVIAIGAPALGADPSTTAGLVSETAMTLLSDVLQLATGRPAAELIDLDHVRLEGEMRGHPWIVASKGRVGFDADDLLAYAPEARRAFRLGWLAVDPALADTRGIANDVVAREQLGEDWERLRSEAVLLPVHPWQWTHRILPLHAGDVARGRIRWLGEAGGRYLPQQSVRTLADVDHPGRRFLKLPLSILNTSVHRGLPRARALAAPALTAWLKGCCDDDPFLRESGLVLLGEVASASVPHPAFEAIPDVPYQHTEMLGAIWREPVEPHLRPGERAITMAALIHRDPAGTGFVEPLIERSGLDVGAWVRALHEATLPPLLHVLYRFGAAFSPHAQNCMVVLRDDVPVRLVVKDFVDDAQVLAETLPELEDMPAEVRRALGEGVEAPLLAQWLQCGLLVCVHRYLSELLEERLGYPETEFWAAAERVASAYRERFAGELDDRFALFDLEAPALVKLCLNRVRILGRGYADAPDRPVAAAAGWIDNPLAA